MIIKYAACLMVLVQSIGFAKWPSFDLSTVPSSQFRKQVEPFTKSISFMAGHSATLVHSGSTRFYTGLSFGLAADITGETFAENPLFGFPSLHGSFFVSQNLSINGSISGYSSGSDIIHVSGYGYNLLLSESDNSFTALAMNFGYLDGPSQFRCRTIHSSIFRKVETRFIPMVFGFGVNFYSAHINVESENEIPGIIEGQTNFLMAGIVWPVKRRNFGTKIHFHPNSVYLSFDAVTSFR